MANNDLPDPFLRSLFKQDKSLDPVTLCAGFDGGEWRCTELAKHLTEWILEFSLRGSERNLIPKGKIISSVRDAAARIFKNDSGSRGEAGELLLHIACRQEFQTQQLVARLFYKSSLDEQVHGFDCVHFREKNNAVELWLGESKLYSTVDDAISKTRRSIKEHLERGFIKAQKTLILPKIADENAKFAAKVQHLFHKNTPLDEFLDSMIVPTLIACNSNAVMKTKSTTKEYLAAVNSEMIDIADRVRKGSPFNTIRIQPIYVPLKNKEELRKEFGSILTGMQ